MFLCVLFLFVQFFSAKVKIRAKYLKGTRQLAKNGLPHTAVLVLDEHFVQYSFAPEDPTIDACTTATWTTWFQGSEPNRQRWWTAQLAAVDHDERHQHHQRHQRDRHDLRCLADLGRSWQILAAVAELGHSRKVTAKADARRDILDMNGEVGEKPRDCWCEKMRKSQGPTGWLERPLAVDGLIDSSLE